MKKSLKLVALLLAVLMIAAVAFTACTTETTDNTEPDTTTTTTAKPADTTPDTTEPPDGDDIDPDVDGRIVEDPVRSEDATEFDAQFDRAVVKVEYDEEGNIVREFTDSKGQPSAFYTEGWASWNADNEGAHNLFDGKDGFFNVDDTETKLGGDGGAFLMQFDTTEAVTLVAYAFVTGNDSGEYTGRTPIAWELCGSTDGETWVTIDKVYDGGTEDVSHDYFGYTIAEEKQASYQHYQLEVTYTTSGTGVPSVQLNEMYLYIAK